MMVPQHPEPILEVLDCAVRVMTTSLLDRHGEASAPVHRSVREQAACDLLERLHRLRAALTRYQAALEDEAAERIEEESPTSDLTPINYRARVTIKKRAHSHFTTATRAGRWRRASTSCVLAIPGVREHVPDFRVVLDDVSDLSDEALRARARDVASLIVPLTLWALRDGRRKEATRAALLLWAWVIAALWSLPDGRAAVSFVLHYLSLVSEVLTDRDLLDALEERAPGVKEAIMNSAQQWMAEGRAEGEAKGRAEGERRLLERLLRRKFGDSAVDESVLGRLASAGEEQLTEWTDRVLDAQTIEELFS